MLDKQTLPGPQEAPSKGLQDIDPKDLTLAYDDFCIAEEQGDGLGMERAVQRMHRLYLAIYVALSQRGLRGNVEVIEPISVDQTTGLPVSGMIRLADTHYRFEGQKVLGSSYPQAWDRNTCLALLTQYQSNLGYRQVENIPGNFPRIRAIAKKLLGG